jgi:AcrR family transcriptional regulator
MARPTKAESAIKGDPHQLILHSAREEIQKNGILGLRVAEVAKNAHYSVSAIYRLFGDRDGLLAQVLGDMYEELLTDRASRLKSHISEHGEISVDDIVALAPAPSSPETLAIGRTRVQILAVAATNPALEARLKEIAQRHFKNLSGYISQLKSRLPDGQVFDDRVFTIVIVNQLLYYNSLLGNYATSDDDYYRFLKDKVTSIA